MSDIERIIGEIETYIEECKPQAFSGGARIQVEKSRMEEMLMELRLAIPEEVKRYQSMIANRDRILEDANAQAEVIISNANAQAEAVVSDAMVQSSNMMSEHEIMLRATQEANTIVQNAQNESDQILAKASGTAQRYREEAVRYTDGMLNSLQEIITHCIEQSDARFQSYLKSLQSTYDILTSNRQELNYQDAPDMEEEPQSEE